MKYLKRYENFIHDYITNTVNNVNINIDNNLIVIEKQVLNDFESSFWDLSISSSVFTETEKYFIKENLKYTKVDLINEGWMSDTLGNVWDKAKDVGGDILIKIKNKIKIIKDNIKRIIIGVTDFVKKLLTTLGELITNKSNYIVNKVKNEFPTKTKKIIDQKKSNENELHTELQQLKATCDHLKTSISNGLFSKKIDEVDDKIISNAESQINDLSSELKNESLNHDILMAFYEADQEYKVGDIVKYKRKDGSESEKKIERIDGNNYYFMDKEGKEFSKPKSDILNKSGNKLWNGFTKWFLDMEKSTPPIKGKAVWWIKFILKIITLVISPIVKLIEIGVKYISSNTLKATSYVTKQLSGPGVFDFIILGGIIAGIPGLITEFTLLSHKMPEPFSEIFEVVSEFLAEETGFKSILMIIGSFCTTISLYQLTIEFKHLFHGHGESQKPLSSEFSGFNK